MFRAAKMTDYYEIFIIYKFCHGQTAARGIHVACSAFWIASNFKILYKYIFFFISKADSYPYSFLWWKSFGSFSIKTTLIVFICASSLMISHVSCSTLLEKGDPCLTKNNAISIPIRKLNVTFLIIKKILK